MKPDIYTKTILTVIAVMLCVIAVKPLISPDTIASAQAQHGQAAPAKVAMEPAKVVWEYKMIDLSRAGSAFSLGDYSEMTEDGARLPGVDWLAKAEQLGADGWELVSVAPSSNISGQNFAGATTEIMFLYKRQER